MDRVVRTSAGLVRGEVGGGVARFLGIPYAAAPEGPLRFAAPAPPAPWEGTRDAVAFSASPPQLPPAPGMPSSWEPADGLDCLSVNVWTPEGGGAGLPVLVWIYGGAYQVGSSALAIYDGSRLAAHGVVVVTLNYRLGFDGFGLLPGAVANRGHLDQVAALRWVREEIAAFGGDPDLVTVFGESAGAASVAVLMGSPRTKGLFRRAIAQSIPMGYRSVEQAAAITGVLAAELGVEATVEAFTSVAPEALLAVQHVPIRGQVAGITAFGPVIDGDLITDRPWNALDTGAGSEVDLVCGFTHEEFRLFSALTDISSVRPEDVAGPQQLPAEAIADYRAAYPDLTDSALVDTILSDAIFRMPTTWTAEAHARAGGRTWLYDFAWAGPTLGACHSIDVPFTFGSSDTPVAALLLGHPLPPDFEELSGALRASWTAFAATGDPGWPEFTLDAPQTRVWNTPITDGPYPIPASREIWRRARPTP